MKERSARNCIYSVENFVIFVERDSRPRVSHIARQLLPYIISDYAGPSELPEVDVRTSGMEWDEWDGVGVGRYSAPTNRHVARRSTTE